MRLRPWFLAARPKTLTAALVPVAVGLAYATQELPIQWTVALCTLLTAFSIQIGTNLINDALDFKKGADTKTRQGPKRMTVSGELTFSAVYRAGLGCFALAFLFGLPLVAVGGVWIFALLILALLCGYGYTGGPYPIAYNALGELFVFLFFGLAATVGTGYLQTGELSPSLFLMGSAIGLLAVALVAINNLRDREEDQKSKKRTLAVILGVKASRVLITGYLLLPFLLTFVWFIDKSILLAIMPLATLPLATFVVRSVWLNPPGKIYNAFLGMTALVHLLFGTLLVIGLLLKEK